jgi:hypothetical protein
MKTAILFAFALIACSELDPNVGQWRVELASDAAAEDVVELEGGDDDAEPGTVSFRDDIRPIIMRTKDQATALGVGRGCMPCHDGKAAVHAGTALSGLDMSTLGSLRRGGGSSDTRIIVPGKPDESAIVQALRGQYGFAARMPKGSPYWQEEEMRLITTWIREGARGRPDE